MGEGLLKAESSAGPGRPQAGAGEAFVRRGGELWCGGISLSSVAESFGTPTYAYSSEHLLGRYERLREAFAGVELMVAYSVKANGNLAILNRLAAVGSGADIVSAGELQRCLQAGIPADRIVFAGVGKTVPEMSAALRAGIHAFNVESGDELKLLAATAEELGVRAPVALRVNADILAPTPHEYTRTGHAATKFGIPMAEARDLYRFAHDHPRLKVRGIDVHIGSQIVDPAPYRTALTEVVGLVDRLGDDGIRLEFVDLGGGYGVRYGLDDPEIVLEELASAVVPELAARRLRLILEPGRFIVGDAGVLLTTVLYVKRTGEKTFVITDGGMTELLRPSHYGGYHRIEPVVERAGAETVSVDVVGPICENGDFLARDREIPLPETGDVLAVRTAGAYGFTMASNYNGRRRPAEVLIEGGAVHEVRARESYSDLARGETIPPTSRG